MLQRKVSRPGLLSITSLACAARHRASFENQATFTIQIALGDKLSKLELKSVLYDFLLGQSLSYRVC